MRGPAVSADHSGLAEVTRDARRRGPKPGAALAQLPGRRPRRGLAERLVALAAGTRGAARGDPRRAGRRRRERYSWEGVATGAIAAARGPPRELPSALTAGTTMPPHQRIEFRAVMQPPPPSWPLSPPVALIGAAGCGGAGDNADVVAGKQLFVQKCGPATRSTAPGTRGRPARTSTRRSSVPRRTASASRDPRRGGRSRSSIPTAAGPRPHHAREAGRGPGRRQRRLLRGLRRREVRQGHRALANAVPPRPASPPSPRTALAIDADPGGQLLFTASKASAPAGKITIDFANTSGVAHNIAISGKGKTPITPNGKGSFTATYAPGTYTYICEVPGHAPGGHEGHADGQVAAAHRSPERYAAAMARPAPMCSWSPTTSPRAGSHPSGSGRGFAVHDAHDGETGLREAARLSPEVVLLDLRLPDEIGPSVCRRLAEAVPRPAIVMLTGLDDPRDRDAARQAGADDFLVKGLDPDTLADRSRSSSARGAASPAQPRTARAPRRTPRPPQSARACSAPFDGPQSGAPSSRPAPSTAATATTASSTWNIEASWRSGSSALSHQGRSSIRGCRPSCRR